MGSFNGIEGFVTRRFTTKPYKFNFKFKINRLQGNDNAFHLEIEKTIQSLADCEFGYENDRGEVRVDSSQKYSFDYTNKT